MKQAELKLNSNKSMDSMSCPTHYYIHTLTYTTTHHQIATSLANIWPLTPAPGILRQKLLDQVEGGALTHLQRKALTFQDLPGNGFPSQLHMEQLHMLPNCERGFLEGNRSLSTKVQQQKGLKCEALRTSKAERTAMAPQ